MTKLPVVAVLVVLAGCATTEAPSQPPAGAFTAEVKFPPPGTQWVMKGTDDKGSTETTTLKALEEDSYLGRSVYRVAEGDHILLFDKVTANWMATVREGKELFTASPHDGVFSSPLWVGKWWASTFTNYDRVRGQSWTFTNVWKVDAYEEVKVPAGSFKAFRLEASRDRRSTFHSDTIWYVPELGVIVKQRFERNPRHILGYAKITTELLEYRRPGEARDRAIAEGPEELQYEVATKEKVLGAEHQDLVVPLLKLAAVHYQQRKYAEAEPLMRRALAIRERTAGPDNEDLRPILLALADVYVAQRKYAEAEPPLERALSISEKTRGADAQETVKGLTTLVAFYTAQGKYAEAEPFARRRLAALEKTHGGDHPDVIAALQSVADVYLSQEKYAEAESLYQRILAVQERVQGVDHLDVAGTLNALAALYRQQRKYAEAEPLYRRTLAIQEKLLGPEHPTLATMLQIYAGVLRNLNREADATAAEARAAVIWSKGQKR